MAKNNQVSYGFLYYSVGNESRNEALTSVASLKEQMPETPVQIHTDRPDLFANYGIDVVEAEENYSKLYRVNLMQESPFERTIFIDSDTFVLKACFDLFELLRTKELALAHTPPKPLFAKDEIPEAFSGFNAGVFAFRKTNKIMSILEKWGQRFVELKQDIEQVDDETPLRSVLYENPVDMAVLSNHYNFRIAHSQFVNNPSNVRILHGHTNNYQSIVNQLHSGVDALFYYPQEG